LKNNWQIAVYKIVSSIQPSTMSFQMVDIDETDYKTALAKTEQLYNKITSILSNISYIRNNIKIHPCKFYHFKLTRLDNNNGLYICMPPQSIEKGYEVYTITNNVKNFNECIYCDSDNDVINYIYERMYKNEFIENRIKYVYVLLKNQCTSYNIYNRDNTILMKNKNSDNGYMIRFNVEYFAKIYIVQSGKFYEHHKATYITQSPDEFEKKIKEYLENNIQDILIKMLKIIHPKYMDSSDESDATATFSSQHSLNSSYVEMDPE